MHKEVTITLNNNECLICRETKRNALLKPCNHVIACITCSKQLTACLICKELIKALEEIDKCSNCNKREASLIIEPCKHAFSCNECSLINKKCFRCHGSINKYSHLKQLCSDIDRSFVSYQFNLNKSEKMLIKSNFTTNDFDKTQELIKIKEKVCYI